MGTADSEEYMTESCPYEIEQEKKQAEIKRFNMRVLVEPLLILCLIFGYCVAQAYVQNRDQIEHNKALKAENAYLKKPKKAICLFTQNNVVYQYPDCTVVSSKYARLN